jgi:hypothetical protein
MDFLYRISKTLALREGKKDKCHHINMKRPYQNNELVEDMKKIFAYHVLKENYQ